MSSLIGAALPVNIDRIGSQRLNRMDFRPECLFMNPSTDAIASFETAWWPRGGGFTGDQAVDLGLLEATWWGDYNEASGDSSSYGFAGVTRDANGSPVVSCTVLLFRSSDNVLIWSGVSDPTTGAFTAATPYYPDAHYIVCFKSGSPFIAGVTPNTMVGA